MMTTAEILQHLKGVKRDGQGWKAICPAHDDHDPSLAIGTGDDGRTLLCCRAGCKTKVVVKALGCTMADIGPTNGRVKTKPKGLGPIVASYEYRERRRAPVGRRGNAI
jgi:putative DNA primase/helicase